VPREHRRVKRSTGPIGSSLLGGVVFAQQAAASRYIATCWAIANGADSEFLAVVHVTLGSKSLRTRLASQVMIAGHHGSRTSSRRALDAVGASVFVVSSGPRKYGSVVLPDADIIGCLPY
jgi:hypothetical protein